MRVKKTYIALVAALIVAVALVWSLKPRSLRDFLDSSPIKLTRKERENSDMFAPWTPTIGLYSYSGLTRQRLVNLLKEAGFRTEVSESWGSAPGQSGPLKVTATQFIRQNHLLPFLGTQRAWISTTSEWSRLYLDPDLN